MPLRIGDTFAGYRVLQLLGSGGMGEVYLVQHPRLPRQEALKVLRPQFAQDDSFRDRFIREADLASGLRHPHIVGIHDRGEYDGQLWIAMDFIQGTDLSHLLEHRYPQGMPVGHVLPIVAAIAGALDYAHKKGLLHRDVKPANIIVADLDGDPNIFLADFGIARPLDDTSSITTTNMTVGTVAYAAPEQLMGEPMDGTADQYALAATAYHLLTGSQLFPNSNPAVVISRHLGTTPPALGDLRPELAALDEPLRRALEKSPRTRYSSCTALSLALSGASAPTASQQATFLAPVVDKRTVAKPSSGRAIPPTSTLWQQRPQEQVEARGARPRTSLIVGTTAMIALLIGVALALVVAPWDQNRPAPPTASAPTVARIAPTLTTTSATIETTTSAPTGGSSYEGMICPNTAALTVRTVQSAVLICDEGAGVYTYKGLRLKDNARIDLPGVVPTATGFAVTNKGTRYDISRGGLVIYTEGEVYQEPAVASGP